VVFLKKKILVLSIFCSLFSFHSVSAQANEENVQKNIEFRKQFGLKSDRAYINELTNKKQLQESKYGASLTKEEELQLEKRFDFQREFSTKFQEYKKQKKIGTVLTGMYIDQQAGGKIYIGIKNKTKEKERLYQKELKSLAKTNTNIEFFNTLYSEDDLQTISEKITNERDQLTKNNIEILSTATDFPNQKINIWIKDINNQKILFLKKKYGKDAIEVFEQKDKNTGNRFSATSYYRPLMGGLEIKNNDAKKWDSSQKEYVYLKCSSGFSASKNGYYYLITAGHCDNSLKILDKFSQGGLSNVFGNSSNYKKEGGSVDAMAILINSKDKSNKVYGSMSPLTSYEKSVSEYIGEPVCKSGARTGVTCGTLKTKNYSTYEDGIKWVNLRGTNVKANFGDSGGTVYYKNKLMGVLWGGKDGYTMIYSHVENVMYYLGVTPVLK
jgi:hypothetical protein